MDTLARGVADPDSHDNVTDPGENKKIRKQQLQDICPETGYLAEILNGYGVSFLMSGWTMHIIRL